ncbi:MAG: tyrosine-type recombinase/integrase [Pseudomonadota bacterium]
MPKPRLPQNKGLPKRWRFEHGAYFYNVPKGMENLWEGKKKFRLGGKLSDAYREYAKRLGGIENVRNIGDLLDRYLLEIVPTKSPRHQIEQRRHIKRLREVFGNTFVDSIIPKDIYTYHDKSKVKGQAEREISTFSHVYTKAVEWGYINRHPFKGEVRIISNHKPRTRYIEDWEIEACLTLPSLQKRDTTAMMQAYIKLKQLTGLRKGDLLRLQESNLTVDGIRLTISKTGTPRIISWSDALIESISEAKAARPFDITPHLFCTRNGTSYIDQDGDTSSFNSLWQRFMKRVLKETDVKEKFTEHDIRAKVASDAKNLERARELLGHENSSITKRVYMRKTETVKPAK